MQRAVALCPVDGQIGDDDLDEMVVVTAPRQARATADRCPPLDLLLERAATVTEMALAPLRSSASGRADAERDPVLPTAGKPADAGCPSGGSAPDHLAVSSAVHPAVDGHMATMSIFGGDKDDSDPGTGSGRGGTLGTPSHDAVEDVPSNDDDAMVVSGGGVADPSEDDSSAAGDRGLG